MPQIAGLRGVLPEPSKLKEALAAFSPVAEPAASPAATSSSIQAASPAAGGAASPVAGQASSPAAGGDASPAASQAAAPAPEPTSSPAARPAAPAVTAGNAFAHGLASGALVRDPGRAVYRYHQAFAEPGSGRTLVRKMFVCAVRLEPWTEGLIRPHEATPPAQQAAALAALQASQAMTVPVLAGYRDAATEVERLFRKVESERPTLELTTADHAIHRLWRVQSAELFGQLRRLLAPKKLTVLDGHDRYEAMLAYRDELNARAPLAQYSAANYALMALVNLDDPTLSVAARHRVIRGAPASQTVLAAARKYFIVDKLPGAAKDAAKQQDALAVQLAHQPAFVVTWANEPDAWKLTLSPDVSPTGEGVQAHRALQKLDPIIADTLFIERTMPGAQVETVFRAEDALAPATQADAAVIMRALTIEQISHVSELGQVLPAGSTAFVPALVPGLVSAVIDPDEDSV